MFVFVVYDIESLTLVSVYKSYESAELKKQEYLTECYPGREIGYAYTVTIQKVKLED